MIVSLSTGQLSIQITVLFIADYYNSDCDYDDYNYYDHDADEYDYDNDSDAHYRAATDW